jgi:hypothetical protein
MVGLRWLCPHERRNPNSNPARIAPGSRVLEGGQKLWELVFRTRLPTRQCGEGVLFHRRRNRENIAICGHIGIIDLGLDLVTKKTRKGMNPDLID